uniref:Sorting nexin family member 21 n=1 Tax=Otus sunia TaxID=257818 RepID=A0A8C8AET7_9STRI
MAARILHRLRHALAGEGGWEERAHGGSEAEDFPESSELEDDTEGLSTRLSGTLSFTSHEEEEEDEDKEEEEDGAGEALGEPLQPTGAAAGAEDGEWGPAAERAGGSLLTRQLQELWRKSRGSLAPQRLLFEVTSASVVSERSSKYVVSAPGGAGRAWGGRGSCSLGPTGLALISLCLSPCCSDGAGGSDEPQVTIADGRCGCALPPRRTPHPCGPSAPGAARPRGSSADARLAPQLYTIYLIRSGRFDKAPAAIARRYSDFERLNRRLRCRFGCDMAGVAFPRKRLRRNFTAETIAKRSRAFEQFLSHLHSIAEIRRSPEFLEFFYLQDLRAAQRLTCTGMYREALATWANAYRLQDRLGVCGSGRFLLTLAGLAVCHQELDELGEAHGCCEQALQLLEAQGSHPLLGPFLQAHVHLAWKVGKDKRRSEARLQDLREAGPPLQQQPTLKECLIKEPLE